MTVFGVSSISFEPLVVFTNNFARMSAIKRQCAMLICLTKVSWSSRSKFKIKHCMTVFWVCSLSFEPLVGFTNNFPEMLAMLGRCAVPMFDQGWFKVKVKKLTIFPMLHMGYSSPSVIALVYDFTFLYTGRPAGPTFPTFPTFPYFLIQSPTFPYFKKNSPTIPTFWCVMLSNYRKKALKTCLFTPIFNIKCNFCW